VFPSLEDLADQTQLETLEEVRQGVKHVKKQLLRCEHALAKATLFQLMFPQAEDGAEMMEFIPCLYEIDRQLFLQLEAFGKASPVAGLLSDVHLEEVRRWYS